ncbi:hypothetical protein LXL04_026431 [Taraxacum kok-saghyz]
MIGCRLRFKDMFAPTGTPSVSSVTDTLLCKKAVNFPPASGTFLSAYGAPVIRFIAIYFMITEAEAQVFLFSHVDVWQFFQRELWFPVLICDLGIADSNVIFKIKSTTIGFV